MTKSFDDLLAQGLNRLPYEKRVLLLPGAQDDAVLEAVKAA